MIKIKKLGFIPLFLLLACQNEQNLSSNTMPDSMPKKAVVKEVIQTTSYTYLKVLKNNEYQWIAINKQEIQEGAGIYYEEGLRMENFTSPELQRTFDIVYFVQEISQTPIKKEMPPVISGTEPQKPMLTKQNIKIEQPQGAVSIANLYSKRNSYSGKKITVRGKVTKVNLAIMNRNWIHIQDGTADGENFDLTVTTTDAPQQGDIITYSGVLKLNRDFGMGYSYEILLEDAVSVDIN